MMCVAKKMCTFCFSNKMNVLSYITKHGAGRGQHRSVDMKTVKARQAKCSHKVQVHHVYVSICLSNKILHACASLIPTHDLQPVCYTSCKRVHNSLHVSEEKR